VDNTARSGHLSRSRRSMWHRIGDMVGGRSYLMIFADCKPKGLVLESRS
jgi:hypothetical protein